MDKPRPSNPLVTPPDEVLGAIVEIESLPAFESIRSWVNSCYGSTIHRLPFPKEEVDLRVMQGQAQALLLIYKAFTAARQELQARHQKAAEAEAQRNL
jgi:hypothetical protein